MADLPPTPHDPWRWTSTATAILVLLALLFLAAAGFKAPPL